MPRQSVHHRPAWRAAIIAVASLCLWSIGCSVPAAETPVGTFGLDFSSVPSDGGPAAMVFFVDGLNASVFEEMLTAGDLPAIQKYFVDRGLYAPRAVANIPSVTLANQVSVVTGQFPGRHGVVANKWFDRNALVRRNYETIDQKNTLDDDYTAATIYEALADRTTVSIFFQAHRGATKWFENRLSASPPFMMGWYEFVDRLTLWRLTEVIELAQQRRAMPALTVIYLLAPDFRGYGHGVDSDEYRKAIAHTDTQIGRVLADMDRAGLLDTMHIALVSDHGMTAVGGHFLLERFLRERVGLSVAGRWLWERMPFEQRLDAYQRHSAVVNITGDRYAAVSVRRPMRRDDGEPDFAPWPQRPGLEDVRIYPSPTGPVDLPALLVAQEAVDVVAYAAGPGRVRIRRADGEVEFHQDEGGIRYRVVEGDDPLGWAGRIDERLLSGEPVSASEWLAATVETEFPGLPERIVAYFGAQRAGDLVVFAAPGWDFKSRFRSGHGGLSPAEMFTPMLLAGPGVPNERLAVAQTVDLMPTLLALLGGAAPEELDGVDLLRAGEGPASLPAGAIAEPAP
ncbi:hypothetical protein LCGC14_0019400 [marine sediment metagenome]|uniref:Alkaline phosphatase family protein n=1 Tax=marine sediment metagenome TaxID=412755 RepID=A0A0F9Z2W4_9ZZZZ|nr:hypothetical protein [Phycisphaerae bacterium]HDZ44526.1 hypothetical protein [Phycisphaerae bacterium]